MQEIIDGIVCDTEKAELIATATEGKWHNNAYLYQQTYKTKDNYYFRYIQSNTDPQYKNGKIVLLSKQEALSYWFQKKG